MEQKLLFEVDLSAEGTATTAEKAKSLELIARTSMLNDALEKWGDRVFTDGAREESARSTRRAAEHQVPRAS